MRWTSPTKSYSISVPDEVVEDYDKNVVSIWKKEQTLLLQISSYTRFEGPQVNATIRLTDLLEREPLTKVSYEAPFNVDCPDYAAASGFDNEGVMWVYAYAVWPDLSIMISVSGNKKDLLDKENWVFQSIRSLRRND